MSTELLQQFCGKGENFTPWIKLKDDFGGCFEQIVLICPSYVILAIFSAYYISASKYKSQGAFLPLPLYVKFRLLCVIMLSVVQVTEVVVRRILNMSLSYSDIVTASVVAFSWLVHAIYVVRLKYVFWSSWRGANSVVIIFMLTVISLAAQLHTNIIQRLHNSSFHNTVQEICVYVSAFLQLCYLLSFLCGNARAGAPHSSTYYEAINESVNERSSLLDGSISNYASVSPPPRGENVTAEYRINCLSWLTFYWVHQLLTKGARNCIRSASDLYLLPVRLSTGKLYRKFTAILLGNASLYMPSSDSSIQNSSSTRINSIVDVEFSKPNRSSSATVESKQIGLLLALHKAFALEYYSLGILKLLADSFGFAGPVLLNLLVSYMESKAEPENNGYLYAVGLFVATLLGSLCSTQFDYNCSVIGFKLRAAVITTIYRKSLSVSNAGVSKFTTGQITNYMSTDTDRIVNFCPSFHAMWSLPFQIAVSLYLLHQQVGLAFLAGLGFAILLIPINRLLAKKIGELSKAMMEQKDNRVKVMNEILFGIRVVKFYSWEDHFESKIRQLRDAELKSLKGRKYLDAMCVYFWATTPVLISILTFTTYSLMGNQLTSAKVFTSLSLFLMLISPLNAFPWVLNGLMEAWVSLNRVQDFVALNDLDFEQYYSSTAVLPTDCALSIRDAEFSWQYLSSNKTTPVSGSGQDLQSSDVVSDAIPTDSQIEEYVQHHGTLLLSGINLTINKGQYVGVIGKVGSGKSSLLNCLLAEMHRVRGHIRVNDLDLGFAIATQEPWLQHASIQDNILFGRQFSTSKYERVIEACALQEDFKVLPAGDKTEVGENGVTLSGGQKARVALARAAYQNKEIYLLDDPLAAVDSHVAQHLYQKCIMGLLCEKTRILCTHHTKYLLNADLVIVMEDGKIIKSGVPSEVLKSIDLTWSYPMEKNDSNSCTVEPCVTVEFPSSSYLGRLVEEEGRGTGVVKFNVYKTYWRSVGTYLAAAVLLAMFLMQGSRNVNDWWLSYWVSQSQTPAHNSTNDTTMSKSQHYVLANSVVSVNKHLGGLAATSGNQVMFYLIVYGCLAGANSVFTLLRAFLFAYGGICAARTLHSKLLNNILKAPVSFFDVTPLGRVVNRFSTDVYCIDDSLPFIMNIFLAQIFGILGTIVITCYGIPWFAVVLLPLAVLYYKIQSYYRKTSREIKRISSVTLSPIYAHFSETISGLVTIRAMREQGRFQKENLERLDINQRAQFASLAVASWLAFRLQMLGVIMVTGIAFIAILEHHFQIADPGLIGLALSYALSFTNLLSGVVNSFAETEKQMVSVERAQQYIEDVPNERLNGVLLPPPYWPLQGSIVFRNVKMKYRNNLTDALNNVSFEVRPAEKVGIVGRTGSGKSSLFVTLFRMVEIYKGNIYVDGIELVHLDLKDIRSRLAVIPQDPFLFSGTVHENLDPTNRYSHNEIWSVLEKCHLYESVTRLGGLDADVGERGKYFSVGQRQLICLARAILTKAKILCIDEATASVDMETDVLIQQAIRTEFHDSTVLTIAHRISTIMDSDRVLVMNEGRVAEFGPPDTLLMSSDSIFYKLVNRK